MKILPNCLEWAHRITDLALEQGPRFAVDATAGNGNDTAHLARRVGRKGRVWALDIQPDAIQATEKRLTGLDLLNRVTLLPCCHATIAEQIPEKYHGRIGAVMFNLGYLPGGDASIVTRKETTIAALESALSLLRPQGVLTVLVYPAHAGSEHKAVVEWAGALDQNQTECLWYHFPNQQNNPPSLLCFERRR